MANSNTTTALDTAPAVAKPPEKPKTFPAMIEQFKSQIALALPKHLNADRMARIALTEFHKNPKLAEATPVSVFASVVIAAQLGLEPGMQGHGYLVPYFDNKRQQLICQFIPGWRGLVDLAQRSGRATAWTGAVFDGDSFEYQYGTDPFIRHKPGGEDDPKKLLFTYAVGRVRGAEYPQIEVWPIEKVWVHRDRFNKVGKNHYSFAHPEMYARKVPLLQVLKYLPQSIELATGVALEHAAQTTGQRLDIEEAVRGTFTFDAAAETAGSDEGSEGGERQPSVTQTENVKEQLRARGGGQAAEGSTSGKQTEL